MHRAHTRTLIILGVILALTQVIGIPFSWKQVLSGVIALCIIGWGLYLRYGKTESHTTEPHTALNHEEPHD